MTTNPSIKLFRQVAVALLREFDSLHYRQLFDWILDRGNATSTSKIPGACLNATIAVDIKRLAHKSLKDGSAIARTGLRRGLRHRSSIQPSVFGERLVPVIGSASFAFQRVVVPLPQWQDSCRLGLRGGSSPPDLPSLLQR